MSQQKLVYLEQLLEVNAELNNKKIAALLTDSSLCWL